MWSIPVIWNYLRYHLSMKLQDYILDEGIPDCPYFTIGTSCFDAHSIDYAHCFWLVPCCCRGQWQQDQVMS